jgi:polyvinyl alcohol dehydrogenase (cytochrome)
VLLDPRDGSSQWQTYMISAAEQLRGSAGIGVWSTPTYDQESQTLYVTTGNNYTTMTTGKSDAIIALNAQSGQFRWVKQRTPNDSWNLHFPFSSSHPDADFGDSPQIYQIHGRKVVGAGQKSGFYHVADATTGAVVNQVQLEVDGLLGGLFADSAVAQGTVFANGINWPTAPSGAPVGGDLFALSGDGSQQLWRFSTPSSVNMSGVAVAGGVVYFLSLQDGGLYALDARSGTLIKRVSVGPGTSGPSVSRGRVYVGTGSFFDPPGTPASLVALGL